MERTSRCTGRLLSTKCDAFQCICHSQSANQWVRTNLQSLVPIIWWKTRFSWFGLIQRVLRITLTQNYNRLFRHMERSSVWWIIKDKNEQWNFLLLSDFINHSYEIDLWYNYQIFPIFPKKIKFKFKKITKNLEIFNFFSKLKKKSKNFKS